MATPCAQCFSGFSLRHCRRPGTLSLLQFPLLYMARVKNLESLSSTRLLPIAPTLLGSWDFHPWKLRNMQGDLFHARPSYELYLELQLTCGNKVRILDLLSPWPSGTQWAPRLCHRHTVFLFSWPLWDQNPLWHFSGLTLWCHCSRSAPPGILQCLTWLGLPPAPCQKWWQLYSLG